MHNTVTRAGDAERFVCYLKELEKSPATISKYWHDVEAFCCFAGDRAIDRQLMLEYKQRLISRYSPASANSMLAAVNCYLKWLGCFDCTVRYIKVQQRSFRCKEQILSQDEYFRLLYAARSRGKLRLFYLLQTICATGIRVSELQFITTHSVEKGWAIVEMKGKTRQILLPQTLCRQLQQYAKQQGIDSGSIFVTRSGKPLDRSNILHDMKALCSLADVEKSKVFPHNLRHLFACEYYAKEKDLCRLADILGHSSLNTTRIYTSLSGEEQRSQLDNLGLVMELP